jgi:hypothetical protein
MRRAFVEAWPCCTAVFAIGRAEDVNFRSEMPGSSSSPSCPLRKKTFHVYEFRRNVAVYARLNPVLQDRACGATSGSIEGAGLV